MKTHVGPMIRLIQSYLNNCSPLICSRNVRWDGVKVPPWSGDSTDQENVALLNPRSSRSIVVGISPCNGLSANDSNNSVLCKNSVTRSNDTLAEMEGMSERPMWLSRTYLESQHSFDMTSLVTPSSIKKTPIYWRRSWKLHSANRLSNDLLLKWCTHL